MALSAEGTRLTDANGILQQRLAARAAGVGSLFGATSTPATSTDRPSAGSLRTSL